MRPFVFDIMNRIMKARFDRRRALEKIAFVYGQTPVCSTICPTVGVYNPQPTVSDVLSAIGISQAIGVGTQQERVDAFGRIINSGLVNSSPAGNALRMLGGGLLGRAVTSAITGNSFLKGLGTGIGAVSAINKW